MYVRTLKFGFLALEVNNKQLCDAGLVSIAGWFENVEGRNRDKCNTRR